MERQIERRIDRYIARVLEGKIVVGDLHRLAVERHFNDLSADGEWVFNRKLAARAVRFFSYLKHSKGEWAGKTFDLAPWQEFLIWTLFGWVHAETGHRRFHRAYITTARKNGKTTLAAGVGLYLFAADGEPGAEVYCAGTKRDQARITHSEAIRMVRSSKLLQEAGVQKFRDNLCIEETASKFEPLGADADTLDGLNIHGVIIDELHAHKRRLVWDVLNTATAARRQPLVFAITTAGYDRATVCYEQHEYASKVLRGLVTNDKLFALICSIDEGDDWRDEGIWPKANPNLGVSVHIEDLREKARQADKLTGFLNSFLRLHLNCWTQQSDRWISMELWDSQRKGRCEAELLGEPCFAGLDLSSTSDITAFVMAFPKEDDVDLLCRFWAPEAALTRGVYADNYAEWHRDGYLTITPGNALDYEFVRAQINDDAEKFNIQAINIDRLFQGYQLMMELSQDLEGKTVVSPMGQGFMSMAVPMRELERLLLQKSIRHNGNPVLRWMADNVSVKQDPAGNFKPDKANSQGKIDGIVATVMALDLVIRHREVQGPSVYATRGVRKIQLGKGRGRR